MKSFPETLNYASSNEDSRSEIKALHIAEDDTVLCITGSGGRALDLLIEKPAKIVSIDFNPCQNYLLELKLAAIQQLEYEAFLEFIGVCPSQKRKQRYNRIRKALSPAAAGFWDNHYAKIEKSVIYQGRWERYFKRLTRLINLVRPRLVSRLFDCDNISEQSRLWREAWNNGTWRAFLRCISSRSVWKYGFGDPGFYQNVPDDFSIHSYLENKFNAAFKNILVNQSPFATLLFFGKYDTNGALPPHLQIENYPTLKEFWPRVEIVSDSLGEYLGHGEREQFRKYSLSDFSSYSNTEQYQRIWKGILCTAAPGARICERQFLVKREIPAEIRRYLSRNKKLEDELEVRDDSIFYTFVIAETGENNRG